MRPSGPPLPIVGPRPGRMRQRRGRDARGPFALPGPLSPHGLPVQRTRREHFDGLVAELLDLLEPHFRSETDEVEVVVEEAPLLPATWDEPVPLSQVMRERTPLRVVVYRLPIAQRASDEEMLKDVAWTTVIDALAEVWSTPPEALDPRSR
jgi:predicted Zn-dependent protease with MMP-like domain